MLGLYWSIYSKKAYILRINGVDINISYIIKIIYLCYAIKNSTIEQ